jgi:hypothetical protein
MVGMVVDMAVDMAVDMEDMDMGIVHTTGNTLISLRIKFESLNFKFFFHV